ncbi:MAG TPA: hypothetical protein VF882_01060 [Gemmatimonadales bacterium]
MSWTERPPTLAGYARCVPEQAGADLGRALAALLCAGQQHAGPGPCAACARSGELLAAPVGGALFAVRATGGPRPVSPRDLEAIGRALDLLERAAGTGQAPAPVRNDPRLRRRR